MFGQIFEIFNILLFWKWSSLRLSFPPKTSNRLKFTKDWVCKANPQGFSKHSESILGELQPPALLIYRATLGPGRKPSDSALHPSYDSAHPTEGCARTGICKKLPYYRVMGPNFRCAKGLHRPKIGLHAKGLDRISVVLLLILACRYDFYVVLMISDALNGSLNIY